MKFSPTEIDGACIVELDELTDERGFFARSFCAREFQENNLNPTVTQCNISFNKERGTLRGMHSQAEGFQEAKLVRVTAGAIFDVIIDLRPNSPTYMKHLGVELTSLNRKMLYVPEGFFHGFLTLKDNTEIYYQMSEFYVSGNELGVRWNDPIFKIDWPEKIKVISDRDAQYPDYHPVK